jgi:1-phosphofructokinase
VIITVTPNPAVDRTLDVPGLVPGTVNRARARHVEPSGKGVNVTRALTVNGVRSTAVLPVGGVEGAQLTAMLDGEGVSYVPVPVTEPVRTNISLRTPDGAVTKVNEPGPTLSWAEADALSEAALGRAASHGCVVASGTLPPGVSTDFYADLGGRVQGGGGWFALDSSGEALRRGLRAGPGLVKPNLEELAELTDTALPTLGAVLGAADDVRRTTGGSVLVSLGAAGALLVDDDGAVHAEAAHPVSVRSTIGAGDNLLAGFLAASLAGHDEGPRRAGSHREAAIAEAVAWSLVAVRARGSVGRAVTEADRRAVRVHRSPDLGRVLARPGPENG